MAKIEKLNCEGTKQSGKCKMKIRDLVNGKRDGYVNAKNGLYAFRNGKPIKLSDKHTNKKSLILLAELYAEKG